MSSQAPQVSEQVQSRYHLKPSTLPRTTAGLYEGEDASGAPVLVRALAEEAFASAAERQRAKREVQKLAQVRHASLASVFDSGEEGAVLWYARERVAGETLAARVERKGALPPGEAAWVAMKVAGALAELHRHGVQHRDVRPERVVLTADGGVKLLDAAVGRVVRLADGRAIPGTPGYVAPEAITGRLVSFRSDLYALGAVLYEMLVGRATFPVADPARRLQLQVEGDPEALPNALPEPLVRFTSSLLSREQRDRPFSAQQVERQLEPFATAPAAAPAAPPSDTDGERTVAFESPVTSGRPSPLGATPYDDRADDAPTRMNVGLSEPGGRTLVGLDGPAAQAAQAVAPAAPPAPAAAATGSAPPGGTLNTRLPKMPTLPPIPAGAMRVSAPGIAPTSPSGAPAAPPPAAAAAPPPRKTTMMGMPMSELQGAAAAPVAAAPAPVIAPSAPPSPPAPAAKPALSLAKPGAGGGLDYDDLGDTTVNDDSRAFGLPGYPPPASAGEGAPMPPRAATSIGYAVSAGGAIAPGTPAVPPPAVATTPGVGSFDVSSTVMAPPPPGVMPPQAAPPRPSIPEPPPLQPNLPPVFGPKPIPYSEYPPAPPRKESNAGMWVAAAFGVIVVAGVGGLAVAKFTGGGNPEGTPAEVTVVPPQPVVAQPDPNGVAANPPMAPEAQPPAMQPMAEPQPVAAPPTEPAPAEAQPVALEPTAAPVRVREPERERPVARAQPAQPAQPAARAQPTQPAARAQPAQPAARTQPAQPAARTQPAAASGPVAAGDPRIAEALRTRNYQQARTLLQGALRSQPNNAGLHAQLGNVFERLGDRNAALNEYRTATRIDRRNTTYLHRLADLQVATGDRAGAQATLRQILSITPNDRGAQARLQSLGG